MSFGQALLVAVLAAALTVLVVHTKAVVMACRMMTVALLADSGGVRECVRPHSGASDRHREPVMTRIGVGHTECRYTQAE